MEKGQDEIQIEKKDTNENKSKDKKSIPNGVNANDGETAENKEAADKETKSEPKPPRKSYKYDDPPIVYRQVDGLSAVKKLSELISDLLNDEEKQYLKDWAEYMRTENEAWILGNEHIDLISRLLHEEEGKYPPNVPLLTLELLQAAALKDDFVLVLHQDRKDHKLMSYIYKIESLTLAEQEEIARLLCNFCSQPCSFDWLMYISEWSEPDGTVASNSRVTTRVAVHTLLNDKLTTLQETGINLIFNLALKELFEEVATELATAVLQFLHGKLEEQQTYLCLVSLLRFMFISNNDVPALTQMLGPDINKFRGISKKIDEVVEQINVKVSAALSASKHEFK